MEEKEEKAKEREQRAMREASATIFGLHKAIVDARRAPPIMLVAVADCEIGQRIIVDRFGTRVLQGLCGPIVIPMAEDEFVATVAFGDVEKRAAIIGSMSTVDHRTGDVMVALAVNESAVEMVRMSFGAVKA